MRRKKCDETRPSCLMCTRTGRKCEGYQITPDRRTRASRDAEKFVSPTSDEIAETGNARFSQAFLSSTLWPLVDPGQVGLTHSERWHLYHFRGYTSIHCAGFFYDEFWQRLVHQIGEEQPAACHAAIAMTAQHYHFELVKLGHIPEGQNALTLQQCNKAIACLRRQLLGQQYYNCCKEGVLVTCVILTTLALFQEDIHAAGCHLQSGRRLLEEWWETDLNTSSIGPALKYAFAQLQSHWSTCADPKTFAKDGLSALPPIAANDPQIPGYHNDPGVVDDFVLILRWLVIQNHPRGFGFTAENSFIAKGEPAILSRLRLMRSQLKASIRLQGEKASQKNRDALELLELWTEVIYIKVITQDRPCPLEMRYDGLLQHFQRVVTLSKRLLALNCSRQSGSTFSTKTAIIPPLLFCGLKCRDWSVRSEVLRLLQGVEDRDTEAYGTALVMRRLVEIESEGVAPGQLIPESARIDAVHVEFRPEESRIHLKYHRARFSERRDSINNSNGSWSSEFVGTRCLPTHDLSNRLFNPDSLITTETTRSL